MKTQIRKSCFETNSSSMHAIVITNSKPDTEYIGSLNFTVDEFGWNHIRYYDPNYKASYLWTIIVNNFLKQVYTGEKISLNGQEYDKCYFVFDIDNPEYQQIKKDITDKLAAIGMNVDEWNLTFQEEFPKTDWGGLETGYVNHSPGIGFVKEILYGPDDRFIRFLFNRDSIVETWNDNEWDIEEYVEEKLTEEYWDEEKQEWKEGYWEAENWAHFMLPPEDRIEWKYLKDN